LTVIAQRLADRGTPCGCVRIRLVRNSMLVFDFGSNPTLLFPEPRNRRLQRRFRWSSCMFDGRQSVHALGNHQFRKRVRQRGFSRNLHSRDVLHSMDVFHNGFVSNGRHYSKRTPPKPNFGKYLFEQVFANVCLNQLMKHFCLLLHFPGLQLSQAKKQTISENFNNRKRVLQ